MTLQRRLAAEALGSPDTFAGIRPADVPGFVVAQVVGALARVSFEPE